MVGYLKTVAHAILSFDAVYLHLCMYRCGCTYRVTLSVQLRNATTVTDKAKHYAGRGR